MRSKRIYCDSQIYHVIMRGNNKQNLFHNDKDRILFIDRMKKYTLQLNIEMYGFCLMDNHVHMLIGKANLHMSLFIQKLANSYVYYYNHKYDCSGHLFHGRFKSEPVNDDVYFKTALRYILQNPENANICPYSTYKWSSFYKTQCYLNDNTWIKSDRVRKLFTSIDNMKSFFSHKSKSVCMEYENKRFISDEKLSIIIHKLFSGIKPMNFLIDKPEECYTIFAELINKGISVSQISRITGIRRHLIKTKTCI